MAREGLGIANISNRLTAQDNFDNQTQECPIPISVAEQLVDINSRLMKLSVSVEISLSKIKGSVPQNDKADIAKNPELTQQYILCQIRDQIFKLEYQANELSGQV